MGDFFSDLTEMFRIVDAKAIRCWTWSWGSMSWAAAHWPCHMALLHVPLVGGVGSLDAILPIDFSFPNLWGRWCISVQRSSMIALNAHRPVSKSFINSYLYKTFPTFVKFRDSNSLMKMRICQPPHVGMLISEVSCVSESFCFPQMSKWVDERGMPTRSDPD